MQQFNHNFIDLQLMPLIKDILGSVTKGEEAYQRNFILDAKPGTASEKMRLIIAAIEQKKHYFTRSDVPFSKAEEPQIRAEFIQYLFAFIQKAGANTEDRARRLLPQVDVQGNFQWSDFTKRNVYLMAYGIAQKFEKTRIQKLIEKDQEAKKITPEQAAADQKLNNRGGLILTKESGDADFKHYRARRQITLQAPIVQFVPPPAAAGAGAAIAAVTLAEEVTIYNNEVELAQEFQRRTSQALKIQLMAQGLVIADQVAIDAAGIATCSAISGNDELQITANTAVPADQDLQFTFQFKNDPTKKFTLAESQLVAAFQDKDGNPRDANAVYQELSSQPGFDPNQPPKQVGKSPAATTITLPVTPKTAAEKTPSSELGAPTTPLIQPLAITPAAPTSAPTPIVPQAVPVLKPDLVAPVYRTPQGQSVQPTTVMYQKRVLAARQKFNVEQLKKIRKSKTGKTSNKVSAQMKEISSKKQQIQAIPQPIQPEAQAAPQKRKNPDRWKKIAIFAGSTAIMGTPLVALFFGK